jgi:hypothetical protein
MRTDPRYRHRPPTPRCRSSGSSTRRRNRPQAVARRARGCRSTRATPRAGHRGASAPRGSRRTSATCGSRSSSTSRALHSSWSSLTVRGASLVRCHCRSSTRGRRLRQPERSPAGFPSPGERNRKPPCCGGFVPFHEGLHWSSEGERVRSTTFRAVEVIGDAEAMDQTTLAFSRPYPRPRSSCSPGP